MIWLAWRRLRGQAILAGAIVLVAVAAALVTGPHLFHAYDTTVARCTGQCSAVDNAFLLNNTYWKIGFDDLVIVVPALFGALVGAPLIAVGSRDRRLQTRVDPERHAHPMARDEARRRERSHPRRRRAAQPRRHLVGEPHRHDGTESLHARDLRCPRHRAARLRVVRPRPRCGSRVGDQADIAGDGRDDRGVRYAVAELLRPRYMAPLHLVREDRTLNPTPFSMGNIPELNRFDWVESELTINKAGRVIGTDRFVGGTGDQVRGLGGGTVLPSRPGWQRQPARPALRRSRVGAARLPQPRNCRRCDCQAGRVQLAVNADVRVLDSGETAKDVERWVQTTSPTPSSARTGNSPLLAPR